MLLTLTVIAIIGITGQTTAQARNPHTVKLHHHRSQCVDVKEGVKFYRQSTWRMQDFMGEHRTRTRYHEKWAKSCSYIKWVAGMWRDRAREENKRYENPPHKSAWLCIHHYEGSWTDSGAPYYGGLQMDEGFQKTYGITLYRSKGTADHWTPLEQMWVAERAYRTRGFWPWPNTARYCGLI